MRARCQLKSGKILHKCTMSPWAIMRRCLRHRTFSHFSRTPTCDRHIQTDRHMAMAYTAQSIARMVKITQMLSLLSVKFGSAFLYQLF